MKKVMSLALAGVLFLFVGCTKETEVAQKSILMNTLPVELTTDVAAPYSLPLEKNEGATLKIAAFENLYGAASYAENLPVWQEIERRTGVKIEWEVIPSSQYAVVMRTRLAASRDIPDIFCLPDDSMVPQLASSELLLPLNGYINEYGQHTKKLYEKFPEAYLLNRDQDGVVYTLSDVYTEGNTVKMYAALIRKDWLETLGLSIPETLEEWTETLTAFKNQDPNGNGMKDEVPLAVSTMISLAPFASAYGLHSAYSGFWGVDALGKVQYEVLTNRYRDYITYLNMLYRNGLLKFFLNDQNGRNLLVHQNSVGCTGAEMSGISQNYIKGLISAGVKAPQVVSILPPKTPSADIVFEERTSIARRVAVYKNTANPDMAFKWLDYVWGSEDANVLLNFGIEGVSYNMVDGKPILSDWTLNNPNGLDPASAVRSLGAFPSFLNVQNGEFLKQWSSEGEIEFAAKAVSNMAKPFPLQVILTNEETQILSAYNSDISSYFEEMQIKFIMGTEPLSKFDEFVSTLKEMGVEELTKVRQAQYDRYKK
ncbi:MAG: extracellular solute-binding protein [Firmicutes bacterium]|nr:extracellular solute-binding protein [Bacillota bacterium]